MNSPNNNIYILLLKKFYVKCINIGVVLFLFSQAGFSQEIDPNGLNTFYYENGRIASEGNFLNGLPEGVWKNYYPDGTLKSVGTKVAGKSDSTWVFYDTEGRKRKIFQYQDDQKNGCAIFLDTNNNVVKELFYLNDVAQGERSEYYPNGALKKQVNMLDGKPEGVLLEFSEEGLVITEEVYDNGFLKEKNTYNRFDENGKKTGLWRTYFPNGSIESEIIYKAGKKSGLLKVYNKKGKLLELQRMEGDTIAGHSDELVIIELYREYHPNGYPKLVGGLDNTMKSGIFREYNEIGEIVNGYIYKKDTLVAEGFISAEGIYQDEWIYYYKNGEIKAKGAYKDGIKEGKWVYYYENGKKEQEGYFKENKLNGDWTWYYQNGQVKRKEFYNRKELLEGTVYEYDSLGNEMTRGDYYNGVQEGEWYYSVGDYKEVGAYTIGLQTGIWKHYYLNGELAFIGAYDEGEAKGKHIYYHQNGLTKLVGKYLGGEKHGKWKAYNNKGEQTQEIEYKRGEIYRIDGFKVEPISEEI